MYASLNGDSLGISAKQNELIELALTYGFKDFDFELASFLRQVESRGSDQATRFVRSAKIGVGCFDLPIDFSAPDAEYAVEKSQLLQHLTVLQVLGAKTGIAHLLPYSDQRPYHEDFELQGRRLAELGTELEPYGVQVAVDFVAPAHHRDDHGPQFIATPDAAMAMVQTIPVDQVGLCLDVWHWHVAGGTVDQLADFPAHRIFVVRLADVPVDADLSTITEVDRLLPGSTGVVLLTAWSDWLKQVGYAGPVTAHCSQKAFKGRKRDDVARILADRLKSFVDANPAEDADSADERTEEVANVN